MSDYKHFKEDLSAVVNGYSRGVFGVIGHIVNAINAADDPAKAMSAFIAGLKPDETVAYYGVAYKDLENLPGVEVKIAENGGTLGVIVGNEAREYPLFDKAAEVARHLVRIEDPFVGEKWETEEGLYELLST